MVSRILSISAHSLMESVVSYGLATTGEGWEENGAAQLDRAALNKAARKVVGANITIRIETLMILADMRNTANHVILKTASILDRISRAGGTTARRSAHNCIRARYEGWAGGWGAEEIPTLEPLVKSVMNPEKGAQIREKGGGEIEVGGTPKNCEVLKRKMRI